MRTIKQQLTVLLNVICYRRSIVSRLKRFEYRDPEKEKLEICTNVI